MLYMYIVNDSVTSHVLTFKFAACCQGWKLIAHGDDFHHNDRKFGFIPRSENIVTKELHQMMPITLHAADFNMDGYPDIATVMRYKIDGDDDDK